MRDVAQGGRVVVAARRDGHDLVHARTASVEDVPATREERLVRRRGGTRSARVELRLPEETKVGLVPDHNVVDRRVASEDAADVGAVGIARRAGEGRGLRRTGHGQYDP